MESDKLWYSFEAEKQGAVGEFIELPISALSPESAAEVLRILLENRPESITEIRVKVRVQ